MPPFNPSEKDLKSPLLPPKKLKFNFSHFKKFSGPGILIAIGYMNPSSFSGDLDAATSAQYKLLWLLSYATIYGLILQLISSRVGAVTGFDLSTICRHAFKKHISFILWVLCELAIITNDIEEVIGSSVALNILFGIPIWAGALITIVDTFLILFTTVYGIQKFEYIYLFLVGSIFLCFFTNMIFIEPDISSLMIGTFYPTIPSNALDQAFGLVISNLTPYNIYLQSAIVQTRIFDRENKYAMREALMYFNLEAFILVFLAFFINLTVISSFAKFYGADLDLNDAGEALKDVFGPVAKYIWALGLICSGQSAALTSTLAGQYVMQGFFNMKVSKFKKALITRSFAIFPSIIILFISDLPTLNAGINFLQVFILFLIMIPLLKVSRNK